MNGKLVKALFKGSKKDPDIFEVVADAIVMGKPSLVRKVLLAHPELVNARHEAGHGRESDDSTPLHFACTKGDVDMARLLLDYGADINARNRLGHTPLHVAVWAGQRNAMELLIGKGARLETPSLVKRRTPLHDAVFQGNTEIIQLLLNRGAHVDPQNEDGETPLHIACRLGREDIATLLLAAGASPDIKDVKGDTPLALAWKNDMEVVSAWYKVHHPDVCELESARKEKEDQVDEEVRAGVGMC